MPTPWMGCKTPEVSVCGWYVCHECKTTSTAQHIALQNTQQTRQLTNLAGSAGDACAGAGLADQSAESGLRLALDFDGALGLGRARPSGGAGGGGVAVGSADGSWNTLDADGLLIRSARALVGVLVGATGTDGLEVELADDQRAGGGDSQESELRYACQHHVTWGNGRARRRGEGKNTSTGTRHYTRV